MSKLSDKLKGAFGEKPKERGVTTFLDSGFPPLNKILSGSFNGGFPVGRLIEIFGAESSGKTAISTAAMISAQRLGGIAMFMDHERSFMTHLAQKMGMNVDELVLEYPDTFEESVTSALKMIKTIREEKMIEDGAPICLVFDSLASMVPQSKFAKEITEQGMNDSLALAKATSSVFPTLALLSEKYNVCVLVLNQEREKPGVMFGDPTTTPGGRAPKFYASIRLQIGGAKIMNGSGKDKEMIGKEVTSKTIKNKITRPFQKTSWRFMFRDDAEGSGYFDVTSSLIEYLIENNLIETAGAYVLWTDGKKYYKKALAKKIDDEGSVDTLKAMLEPKAA